MPADAAEIVRLAERVEQATGADRELDEAIAAFIQDDEEARSDECPSLCMKPFTASLDAAVVVVPDGWYTFLAGQDRHSGRWRWELRGGYGFQRSARANTPALALTAAALRARAAQHDHEVG
jgi:hypothetical protein